MIPSHELHTAFSIAAHAVPDSYPKMPALQCLLIEFTLPDQMLLVGTDGERIAVVTLCLEHQQPTGTSFRMSPDQTRSVLEALDGATDRAMLCVFGDQLIVTAGEICATADRLVDDLEYPKWPAVMTARKATKPLAVPFERALLADALVALAPVADSVMIDVNGLRDRGYVDAVLRDGLECIKAVRIGVSQRVVGA